MSGIEKRCRNARRRSSRIVHIPESTFQGKKLRQCRQAKRLWIAQIILLRCDGQLLHVLNSLKILWDQLETGERLPGSTGGHESRVQSGAESANSEALVSPRDC